MTQAEPSKAVTIHQVPICFETAATSPSAENGSKNTEICLSDPHIFPEEWFAAAETTLRPQTSNYDIACHSWLSSNMRINMKHS
jgi:hypothetical protein